MAPFSSTKKPRGPVLAKHADDDDVYGTFDGRPSPVSYGASNSKVGSLLRVVAIVGVVLLAAGYVARSSSIVSTNDILEVSESGTTDDIATEISVPDLHQQFVNNVNPRNIREYLHTYSSVPHSCGTEQDYKAALFTAKMFESFGIKAEIKEYYSLLSTPIRRHLAILEPVEAARELNLTEASVPHDTCTSDDSALPPFVAYAATGNVTSSIVFVNFGKPEDFEWLKANNVTLKGKIALVRYGGNFRGLKGRRVCAGSSTCTSLGRAFEEPCSSRF
ncbi:hypothetical protein DVH05_013796 [Phytophthora capsici]|nr:hypothetical protein DVH05_013796 [Phytophthora capsici]